MPSLGVRRERLNWSTYGGHGMVSVQCDVCSQDYAENDALGGLVFCDYACGPCCAERIRSDARRLDETGYIRAEAEPGELFRDFVQRQRALLRVSAD